MQTMYEIMRAPTPNELMMLNATVLPMLIKEISAVNMNEKKMELTGKWKWPLTCKIVSIIHQVSDWEPVLRWRSLRMEVGEAAKPSRTGERLLRCIKMCRAVGKS